MAFRFRYIFLCFVFLLSDCLAQSWSPPQRVENLPPVSFSFRLTGTDVSTGEGAAEWVFTNTADTAVTFVYRLVSNNSDTLTGYLSLGGKQREFSGWLIRGDRFVVVEGKHVSVP